MLLFRKVAFDPFLIMVIYITPSINRYHIVVMRNKQKKEAHSDSSNKAVSCNCILLYWEQSVQNDGFWFCSWPQKGSVYLYSPFEVLDSSLISCACLIIVFFTQLFYPIILKEQPL